MMFFHLAANPELSSRMNLFKNPEFRLTAVVVVGLTASTWLLFGNLLGKTFEHVQQRQVNQYTVGNLEAIHYALRQYHAEYGSLPPAAQKNDRNLPVNSWRVHLLPWLGRRNHNLRYKLDEPWFSEWNRQFVSLMPARSPQFGPGVFESWNEDYRPGQQTRFLAVTGPGTPWPDEGTIRLSDIPQPARTVLLLEVPDSQIHWMEPYDLPLSELYITGPVHALFADGNVRLLNPDESRNTELRVLFLLEK